MSSKFEIALEEAGGELVSLEKMSAEALSSFLAVVGSFKALIEDQFDQSKLVYGIVEGSASFEVKSINNSIDSIYVNLNKTIRDGSENKLITSKLKTIQGYLKDENLIFRFNYYKNGEKPVDLKEKVVSSRIKHKRSKREFYYQLEIKSGLVNQVGGNNPNYHLDHGNSDKYTIFCTKEEAQNVNKHLYKNIKVLVLAKVYNKIDKFDVYSHKEIIDNYIFNHLSEFLRNYNRISDLISKLDYFYDFVFELSKNNEILIGFLKYTLIGFNSNEFHPSELKTVLVLSKSFKDIPFIENERRSLLDTYNKLIKN